MDEISTIFFKKYFLKLFLVQNNLKKLKQLINIQN